MYRALVADDETNIREGLSSLVEECGLKIKVVAQAQDGVEALAMFEKYSPDLVLMDINMPLMDGLSCIEKMKAMKENVRVVIVSSYDNFSYAKKAIGLKVDSYILKPIDEEELKQVLKKCLITLDESLIGTHKKEKNPKDIVEFINTHYQDSGLSSEMIEKEFGLSRTSVYTLMKSITDKSLNEYITMIRVRQAGRMLENSSLTLKEIAQACGYTDPFYFSRVFKKQMGLSPSEYKKRMNQENQK